MVIIHFVSRKDMDILFKIFARPIEHHGELDWIPPKWWLVMDMFRRVK